MSRKKNILMASACIVLGMALAGPAAHAAEEVLTAVRSTHQFYLDGERIELEAYLINGNNYVKLADVGEALDFNVYWDGAVQIESAEPYTGRATESASTPEQARQDIAALVNGVRREHGLAELDHRPAADGRRPGTFRKEVHLAPQPGGMRGGGGRRISLRIRLQSSPSSPAPRSPGDPPAGSGELGGLPRAPASHAQPRCGQPRRGRHGGAGRRLLLSAPGRPHHQQPLRMTADPAARPLLKQEGPLFFCPKFRRNGDEAHELSRSYPEQEPSPEQMGEKPTKL